MEHRFALLGRQLLVFEQSLVHILNIDNGIIDERADGDGKTAENHGVDGVVEEVQNDNSHNHR